MAVPTPLPLLSLLLIAGCHAILPLGSPGDAGARTDAPLDAGPPQDSAAPVEPGSDLPVPDAPPVNDAVPDDASPLPDVSTTALCQGLSLYLPFDSSCVSGMDGAGAPVSGSQVQPGGGSVAFQNGGLIGSGCRLTGNGELRFPPGVYNVSAGTVSLWVRITYGAFPPAYTLYFHRAHWVAGPQMSHDHNGQHLGVTNYNADGGMTQAVVANSQVAPYWGTSWNHLVSTWSQGSAERLSFTLNGDPAGGFPTRLTSGTAWTPATSTALFFSVGGSTDYTSAAQYMLDEVALWNRPLSLPEVKLLHALQSQSGKSIGQICGLP